MENLWKDLRFALRGLRKARGGPQFSAGRRATRA
jgi:hypothetical protein